MTHLIGIPSQPTKQSMVVNQNENFKQNSTLELYKDSIAAVISQMSKMSEKLCM